MPSLRCEGQGETGAAYIQQDLLDALSARRSPSHNLEKEVHQQFDLALRKPRATRLAAHTAAEIHRQFD